MPIQELRDEIERVRVECHAAYDRWKELCDRLDKLEREYNRRCCDFALQ